MGVSDDDREARQQQRVCALAEALSRCCDGHHAIIAATALTHVLMRALRQGAKGDQAVFFRAAALVPELLMDEWDAAEEVTSGQAEEAH